MTMGVESPEELAAADARDAIARIRARADADAVVERLKRTGRIVGPLGFPLNLISMAVQDLERVAKHDPDREADLVYTQEAMQVFLREFLSL